MADKKDDFLLHFIPQTLIEKLNIDATKLEYKPKEKNINYSSVNLKKDYLIDMVHNLLLKYYFKRFNEYCLYSLILKEKYGKNYNYYVDWLVENNILELIREYSKGNNSRLYRLNNDIIENKIYRYKNKDNILNRKFNQKHEDIKTKDIVHNIIEHDIKKRLVSDLFSVDINVNDSKQYLKFCNLRRDVYERNIYSIEAIKYKHIFYHFDDYGRMHTNFTILKTFVRKNYITINNEPVYEIDISNSQPRFLVLLIERSNQVVNPTEFKLFKYLVYNGLYYQYLMDNMKITKEEAKKTTYKILFGRNNKTNPLDIEFKNIFPSIHKFIKDYKYQNGGYKILSHTLQKMESNLIFNSICKELYESSDSIKLITIHDSILCQKSHQTIMEIIFYKHIDKIFGEIIETNYNLEKENKNEYILT